MQKNILVCGGAGYIGSHMCQLLAQCGHEVTVLDDLSTGHREAARWGDFVQADLLDIGSLVGVFASNRFDAVMHFCAKSLVGESVRDPYGYYRNNVVGTLNLLEVMRRYGVGQIVFSSTAAVYGHPLTEVIAEDHPKRPINPYGSSKLMVEKMLEDAHRAYDLRSVSLRYFNAAGALPEHGIGEAHVCETHLIPNILKAVIGSGPAVKIFGADYDTVDGTCVRDFVHVQDIAHAHLLALEFMGSHQGAHAFNLGNGSGFSVRQVVDAAGLVAGKRVPFDVSARREGDPAVLVASSEKAHSILGWRPRWTELASIIESAWQWHSNQRF